MLAKLSRKNKVELTRCLHNLTDLTRVLIPQMKASLRGLYLW